METYMPWLITSLNWRRKLWLLMDQETFDGNIIEGIEFRPLEREKKRTWMPDFTLIWNSVSWSVVLASSVSKTKTRSARSSLLLVATMTLTRPSEPKSASLSSPPTDTNDANNKHTSDDAEALIFLLFNVWGGVPGACPWSTVGLELRPVPVDRACFATDSETDLGPPALGIGTRRGSR